MHSIHGEHKKLGTYPGENWGPRTGDAGGKDQGKLGKSTGEAGDKGKGAGLNPSTSLQHLAVGTTRGKMTREDTLY